MLPLWQTINGTSLHVLLCDKKTGHFLDAFLPWQANGTCIIRMLPPCPASGTGITHAASVTSRWDRHYACCHCGKQWDRFYACCFFHKQMGRYYDVTSVAFLTSNWDMYYVLHLLRLLPRPVTTKRVSVTIVTRVRSLVRRFGLAVRR